ncbi:hypothetical protein Tco_0748720 [Tanacetum coccineum]|uniref:Uncharacterized protein n=1 Tax=Tanacetum coccineum TaxID=301880 RepID=A0ABQ4YWE4_9ASTR
MVVLLAWQSTCGQRRSTPRNHSRSTAAVNEVNGGRPPVTPLDTTGQVVDRPVKAGWFPKKTPQNNGPGQVRSWAGSDRVMGRVRVRHVACHVDAEVDNEGITPSSMDRTSDLLVLIFLYIFFLVSRAQLPRRESRLQPVGMDLPNMVGTVEKRKPIKDTVYGFGDEKYWIPPTFQLDDEEGRIACLMLILKNLQENEPKKKWVKVQQCQLLPITHLSLLNHHHLNPKGKKSKRPKEKDTEIPQSSVPSDPTNIADEAVNEEPSMQLKELMDFYTKLQQRVFDLENTKTAQAQEITSLKNRVKKLEKKGRSRTYKLRRLYKVGRCARVVSSDEASLGDHRDASKQGRKIHDNDVDEDITLENVHDAKMFDVNDIHGDEVFVEKEVPVKEVSNVGKVNTASIATTVNAATITKDEITLAQALAELKSVKPKVTTATTTTTKGIHLQEPSESTTTTTTIPSKDKGKGIMVEEPLKIKKNDQINFDEQEAIRLQAEFDEEVRLAREKDEANVALIEEWNDIQAKIETDYELAQRLQAEEQEELTVDEKATLFQQLLEKRRKHFATKKAEEKRNRPPIRAQQRIIMCTYLKNMAGWKPKDLKSKTELVEGTKMEEKNAKKQKVDDDQEAAKLKELMKIIPDEEEVAVDAIPLATKPPSIID